MTFTVNARIVLSATIVAALCCLTSGCTPTAPASSPSPSAPASQSPSALPSAPATEAPAVGDLTAEDVLAIEGAISSGSYSALGHYLGNPVKVTFAATEFSQNRAPASVITDLAYIDGTSGWNFALDDATLASYRAGFYGSYFPADAIVGLSAETYVISIQVTGTQITAIFVAGAANLLVE